PSHATVCRHSDAALLAKRHLYFGGQACRDRQGCAEPLHQTFNLLGVVDHRHAAKATSDLLGSRQFHGSRLCSSCALVRPETMRSSTSVRYAIGSTPLSLALWMSVIAIAHDGLHHRNRQRAPPFWSLVSAGWRAPPRSCPSLRGRRRGTRSVRTSVATRSAWPERDRMHLICAADDLPARCAESPRSDDF